MLYLILGDKASWKNDSNINEHFTVAKIRAMYNKVWESKRAIFWNANETYFFNITKGCNTLNGWYAYKYTDGSVKNMMLKKSSTIICLTIQLLLNIICMILVYSYAIKTKIPVELDVEFPIDLYFSFAGYLLLLLLIVFNIITIICIVSEIINLKNKNTDNSSVKRIIIIPLVFIFCFQLVVAIPAATQKIKNVSDVNLSFDDDYSGVISDLDSYYICVDNPIAKAGYLEKYYTDNNQNIRLLCSYQQGKYSFLNDDFEIIDESEYSFKNKVEKEKYTLYYDIDGDSVSYALTVIKNDFRYIAIFNDENLLKDSYSIEEFVNDSMSIYDEWSRI